MRKLLKVSPNLLMYARSLPAKGKIVRAANGYCSNCNVALAAKHRLKPTRNANSHEGSITAHSPRFAVQTPARCGVRCKLTERLTSAQDEVQ
jgi:hypothetical protein